MVCTWPDSGHSNRILGRDNIIYTLPNLILNGLLHQLSVQYLATTNNMGYSDLPSFATSNASLVVKWERNPLGETCVLGLVLIIEVSRFFLVTFGLAPVP